MNYKMIVQYDGTRYDGWQKQGNTDNTIQGKLEAILSKMAGMPVEVQGAGRTDAGVHAYGQTANFHLPKGCVLTEDIRDYLNKYLPEDIGILEVEEADERFHSRLNAREKVYRYRMSTSSLKNVFERKYIYLLGEHLNVKAMEEAASELIGTHDFKSFCSNKRMKKSSVRKLNRIEFTEQEGELQITYTGEGFLYNMVRIITGTLIEVGQGKRLPKEMKEILEGKDRSLAGVTAPARGLCLVKVLY
ncbi:tRNA pseudouridine(38-40) synthase TruA [uncultured Robinsoniella sp.]|uniref:tRNA pseudouridine(38-40) synthase TruA n=1 Tax=uncultured Robinsoniella sp. TaxID=904190 RepID=UPI00374FD7E0